MEKNVDFGICVKANTCYLIGPQFIPEKYPLQIMSLTKKETGQCFLFVGNIFKFLFYVHVETWVITKLSLGVGGVLYSYQYSIFISINSVSPLRSSFGLWWVKW